MRAVLSTPLRGRRRLLAFGVCAAILVGAALAFGALERPPAGEPSPSVVEAAPEREDANEAALGEPGEVDGGIVEEEPVSGLSAREIEAARRAARAFLAGYLSYTYGGGPASAIDGATAQLLRRLRTERPRQVGVDGGLFEVLALQTEAGAQRTVLARAIVGDEQRTYEVSLTVERIGERWKVSGVGG